MSGGLYGADVAQLRETASEFERAADALDDVCRALTGGLRTAPWRGADADDFRSRWHADGVVPMTDAASRLRDAARALRSNAGAQERTSAADGASTAGGITGGGVGTTRPGGGDAAVDTPAADVATKGAAPGDIADWKASGDSWSLRPDHVTVSDGDSVRIEGDRFVLDNRIGEDVNTATVTDDAVSRRFVWDSFESEGRFHLADGTEVTYKGDTAWGAEGKAGWGSGFTSDIPVGREGEDPVLTVKAKPILDIGANFDGRFGGWSDHTLTLDTDHGVDVPVDTNGFVGVRHDGKAGLMVGVDGIKAGAEASAFAGGELKQAGTVKVDVGGVEAGLGAGMSYGAGASASAIAEIGFDEVHLEAKAGFALGPGIELKPTITFSPRELADDIVGHFRR